MLSDVLKYHEILLFEQRMNVKSYTICVYPCLSFHIILAMLRYAIVVVVSIKLLCLEAFQIVLVRSVGWLVGWSVYMYAIQLDPIRYTAKY